MCNRRSFHTVFALWLLVLLLACTRPRTQIILLVETDMTQGTVGPLTHIRVTVKTPGAAGQRSRLTYPLRAPDTVGRFFELPGTVGIAALDNDGSRSVEVQVDAIEDYMGDGSQTTPMFTHYSIAPFEEEKTLLLRVFLADRCRTAARMCLPNETCGRLGCEPRNRTMLPEVPPDFSPDVKTVDAVSVRDLGPNDVGLDAPRDVGFDASSDIACPHSQSRCSGVCVDTTTEAAHCGGCGRRCAGANATGSCAMGTCRLVCNQGFANCDGNDANGCEVDTRSTATHCGGCGLACNTTGATPRCVMGMCDVTCNAGRGNCDGNAANGCEVNTNTESTHCGACGTACNLPNATARCTAGRCEIDRCTTGFADCDTNAANGCEVNTALSTAHCGRCGNACPAAQLCSGGACGTVCAMPTTRCGSPPACVNTMTSAGHCGGCGVVCPNHPNSSPTCSMGLCGIQCNAGFGNCDSVLTNGCEVSTSASPLHCGRCGNACSFTNAVPSCSNGICMLDRCTEGFGDCDGMATNGCETDLRTSVNHCGTCGSRCNLANATARCNNGRCAIETCNTGFGNCDGNDANGCETNLNTTANCGACGRACMLMNANAVCTMGTCAVASCAPGYGNCDGVPSNGCEVDLQVSTAHCGSCGMRCPLGQSCRGGMCIAMCGTSQVLCSGTCTSTQNDPSNCGACGMRCPNGANATPLCTAGRCSLVCRSGFADCNGNPADGCEVNLDDNVMHCGSCGTVCTTANATASCTSGTCGFTCNRGFENCDGNPRNGCEVNLNTSIEHCGSCGSVCVSGPNSIPMCTTGRCAIRCLGRFIDCDGDPENGCELDPSEACTNDDGCATGFWVCRSGAAVCNATMNTPRCVACAPPGPAFGFCDGAGRCITDGSLVCSDADGGVPGDGGKILVDGGGDGSS